MTTTYGSKSHITNREQPSIKPAGILHLDSFILPWTSETETRRLKRRAAVAEFAFYSVVAATVSYSAAATSLVALMSAIVLSGIYIFLSNSREEAFKTRQEIAARNYRNLASPEFGKN